MKSWRMSTATALAPRDPRPFVPSDLPKDKILVRAVCAHVAAAATPGGHAADIARERWPRDAATLALIQRAASVPASTTGSGWADALAAQATGAFIASLQPSAGASLIAAGVQFDMAGRRQINLPRAQSTGTGRWVGEGQPIPVAQAVLTSVPLNLFKLAIIEAITREVAESAVGGGETTIGMILKDSVRLALDAALFSNAAAVTGVSPAGLLNGISATTASTSTDGFTAALADARTLVDAVVAGGGGSNIMFFASPGRALALRTYLDEAAPPIFGSSAIPAGQLICLDAAAFASGFGATPQIAAATEATVHFEDTTPAQIGTAGSPNVVAAPTRSAFQLELVVLRCILSASFCMRLPAIAHIDTGMTW